MRRTGTWLQQAVTAAVALAALGLVSCGGGDDTATAGTGTAPREARPPVASGPQGTDAPGTAAAERARHVSEIPDVKVLDLASGAEFALGSIVPSERPVLVWFWAPH